MSRLVVREKKNTVSCCSRKSDVDTSSAAVTTARADRGKKRVYQTVYLVVFFHFTVFQNSFTLVLGKTIVDSKKWLFQSARPPPTRWNFHSVNGPIWFCCFRLSFWYHFVLSRDKPNKRRNKYYYSDNFKRKTNIQSSCQELKIRANLRYCGFHRRAADCDLPAAVKYAYNNAF